MAPLGKKTKKRSKGAISFSADLFYRAVYYGKTRHANKIMDLVDFHSEDDEILYFHLSEFEYLLDFDPPPELFVSRISELTELTFKIEL
jgi:hypothetical protein